MGPGPGAPATVTCLHRLILGDGCLIATETGCSCPLWAGCGSPEGLTTGSAYRVMGARCRSISILWLRLRRAPQGPLLSEGLAWSRLQLLRAWWSTQARQGWGSPVVLLWG